MHSQVASKWTQGSVCAAFGAGLFGGRCLSVSAQPRSGSQLVAPTRTKRARRAAPWLATGLPFPLGACGRLASRATLGPQQASARGSQLTLAFED